MASRLLTPEEKSLLLEECGITATETGNVDWYELSNMYSLSEKFMTVFANFLYWSDLVQVQMMSREFLNTHKERIKFLSIDD